MEGVPFFPEKPEDEEDDDDSSLEKKDKKTPRPSLFELLTKEENKDEQKEAFEFFKNKKEEDKAEEKEPPLETLGEDEKIYAAEQFVDARVEDVANELDNSSEEVSAEVIADAALLDNIKEKLENDEPVTEDMLDEAVAETMEDLGLKDEPTETADQIAEESAVEPEDSDEDDDDGGIVPPTATGSGTGSSTVPPPPPPPQTVTGGPGIPPLPPPPGPTPPGPGIPGGMPPIIPGPNFNVVPPAPNINANQQPNQIQEQDRHSHVPYVLVGGIVGYLIGKRRGRIKTEKRLLPVQEKLKKEVTDLHAQIAERETKIRKLTREQQPSKQVLMEKLEIRKEKKEEKANRPERSGKLVIGPEAVQPSKEHLKPVELMSVAEMLVVASGISAEQSTVRRLFENGRLNESGLRRVIKMYLAGERIDYVLRESLVHQNNPELLARQETVGSYQQKTQPVNPVQTQQIPDIKDPISQRLEELGVGAPAPFAQWTEEQKAKKPGMSNQTKMVASIATGVVIAALFVLLVLR